MNKTRNTRMLSTEERRSKLIAELAEIDGIEIEEKVKLDDLVPVMSLLPYSLNLSTKDGGQGNIKKFVRFGEVKQIQYSDLINIMEVHGNFLTAGYFYILNPSVIKQHGLQENYEKILTKEKLEEILSTNSDDCVKLYSSANKGQQEIIIQLLIDKVRNNSDSVNLNIIDKISRTSGTDIIKRAESEKEISESSIEK